MINCLSIDLEDWYQGIETIGFNDWQSYESRIVDETCKILLILKNFNVKATFFIVGYVADNFPELIKKIKTDGHEIGIHGYTHSLVYNESQKEFEKDIKKSIKSITDICSIKISGYRAPLFSVVKDSLWALDILAQCGIKYDSSIYPVKTFLFGIPDAPRFPYEISLKDSRKIIEFPLSTIKLCGKNIPFGGGFFFRFWPYKFISWAVKKININGNPVIIYLHPFDLDPDIPKIKNLSYKRKFIHYYNIGTVEKKLEKLLTEFKFSTISNVLESLIDIKPLSKLL